MAPPVGRGVERLEGISEVNMPVFVGERMNFCVMTPSNDCVKPVDYNSSVWKHDTKEKDSYL